MADEKDIEYVFNKLNEAQAGELNTRMNDTNAGIGAVLKVLDEAKDSVTCGEIAKKMRVSTARVAVLIKKMVAKNLIERNCDKLDARIIHISLTQDGRRMIDELRGLISLHLSRVIDALGMDKIKTYIETGEEIRRVADEVRPELSEFLKSKK